VTTAETTKTTAATTTEIKISEKYKSFVGRQTSSEFTTLKNSIKESGQHVPGIISQNGVLIDGHHRLRACQELGIPFKYDIRKFNDETEELLFIWEVNDKRRHATCVQRAERALQIKPILEERARRNQSLGGKTKEAFTKSGKSSQINVQEELAKQCDLSKGSWSKVEHVLKSNLFEEDEDFRESFRTEEISIDKGFMIVKDLEDDNKPEDIPITEWAKRLEGLTDEERFDACGKKIYGNRQPEKYNHWYYQRTDPRLGLQDHPGRIAGQIVQNWLARWTKQGDLIVDPFCGGGSTIDACIVMNRKCLGYDLAPRRPDIREWDITDGFPDEEECKGCDAIFLDPPYWGMKDKDYKKLSKKTISSLSYPDFLKSMDKLAKDCYDTVKVGGHVGLIMQDMVDNDYSGEYYDIPVDCIIIFRKYFKEVRRIRTPLNEYSKTGFDVHRIFVEKGELLDINRDLIIFRKEQREASA
jgi:hypothetical protein